MNNVIANKNTLNNIIKHGNDKKSIKYKMLDWDDYQFYNMIGRVTFFGRLHARKARVGTVSPEQIFKEHLKDYDILTSYCFFRLVPRLENIIQVEFTILTNRTQGFLHLESLKIVYEREYDFISGIPYNDSTFPIDHIKNEIINNTSDLQIDFHDMHIYLQPSIGADDIKIVIHNRFKKM